MNEALTILQVLACLTLAVAAAKRVTHRSVAGRPGEHRVLFPFIVAAGLLGMVRAYLLGMEWFVVHYSGAPLPGSWSPAAGPPPFPVFGPDPWALLVSAACALLPAFGVIPFVGRRPLAMFILAGVAASSPLWDGLPVF